MLSLHLAHIVAKHASVDLSAFVGVNHLRNHVALHILSVCVDSHHGQSFAAHLLVKLVMNYRMPAAAGLLIYEYSCSFVEIRV